MENEFKKDVYIIMYSIADTEDWIGCFPSELHQWFVMENSKIPKIFDTEKEAKKYAKDNALVSHRIIKVSGNECNEKVFAENIQGTLAFFGIDASLKQSYMIYLAMVYFQRKGLEFNLNDVSEIKFNANTIFGER